MNTTKISRRMLIMMGIIFTLVMAACSPSASPTAAPGATTVPSNGASAGEPADAVKAFYTALFTGGDAASFVCTATGVDAAQLQDGYKQIAAAFANATIDTTGLTFTASNVTADKADVAVGGNLSVDTSGVKTDLPMTIPVVPVVNEGGSWKICG